MLTHLFAQLCPRSKRFPLLLINLLNCGVVLCCGGYFYISAWGRSESYFPKTIALTCSVTYSRELKFKMRLILKYDSLPV